VLPGGGGNGFWVEDAAIGVVAPGVVDGAVDCGGGTSTGRGDDVDAQAPIPVPF